MRAAWSRFLVVVFSIAAAGAIAAGEKTDVPKAAGPSGSTNGTNGSERSAAPPTDAPAPDVRSIDRIDFVGIEGFDVADVRESLEFDFDVAVAAHPHKDLDDYLRVLREKIRLGYVHNGFPDAKVAARCDAAKQRIEIHVIEGPEFTCGDVIVTGTRHTSPERIIRELTENSNTDINPWDPKTNRKNDPIPWRRGERFAFDRDARDEIRKRVRATCEAGGCPEPRFDVEIRRPPQGGALTLEVAIRDEGPLQVVGEIEVTGASRDSVADVVRYLAIQPETPFADDLTARLEERLKATGRYLSVSVKRGPPSESSKEGIVPYAVQIELTELRDAPALFAEPSPVEQALLRLAEWSDRWSRGEVEEDLIVTGQIDHTVLNGIAKSASVGGEPLPAVRVRLRMVIRPRQGWTVRVGAMGPDDDPWMDMTLFAQANRIVIGDLERRAKVELPDCIKSQLVLRLIADTSIQDEKQPRNLQVGVGFRPRGKADAPFFDVQAKFSASHLFFMLHREGATSRLEDGICELRSSDTELRFEAATGRLIAARYSKSDANWLALQAVRDALPDELRQLEAPLAGAGAEDSTLFVFLLEEGAQVLDRSGKVERAKSLRALARLLRGCTLPSLSQMLNLWSAREKNAFRLPGPGSASMTELFGRGSTVRKQIGALLYAAWRKFAPPGSPLTPLGRDAILHWAESDLTLEWDLRSAVDAPETGPVTELILARLSSVLDINLTRAAGRAGLKRLSSADFAKDYEPFLSTDSPLGRLVLSLAESLRQLDEGELRSLLRLLPEPLQQERFVQALLLLQNRKNVPVERALPEVLDRLWTDILRDYFEAMFLELTRPGGRGTARIEAIDVLRGAAVLR